MWSILLVLENTDSPSLLGIANFAFIRAIVLAGFKFADILYVLCIWLSSFNTRSGISLDRRQNVTYPLFQIFYNSGCL